MIFSLVVEAVFEYSLSTAPIVSQHPPAITLEAERGLLFHEPYMITEPKPEGTCRYMTDFKPGKTGKRKVTMPLLQGVGPQRSLVSVGVSFN